MPRNLITAVVSAEEIDPTTTDVLLEAAHFQKGRFLFGFHRTPSFFMCSMRARSSAGISTFGARSSSSHVAA